MSMNVVANAIDWGLELTVLGSFSGIGPRIRSASAGWRSPLPDALAGRTVLVTGPTSGIGRAAALSMAALGARLLLVGRDEERLLELSRRLPEPTGSAGHRVVVADMSSLSSVRAAVHSVLETETRLDVVLDNAGAMFDERVETQDGIERTLALLVCGPFVLLAGLVPLMQESGGARVINVTSGGMYTQAVRLDDLEWQSREFDGPRAYAQAKRIQVELMREWARRSSRAGVSFNAMHPGWTDTPGLAESLPGFYRFMKPILRTPEQGADTITWLATSSAVTPPGGRLYLDRRPRPFDRLPQTRLTLDDRIELWDTIAELTETRPASG